LVAPIQHGVQIVRTLCCGLWVGEHASDVIVGVGHLGDHLAALADVAFPDVVRGGGGGRAVPACFGAEEGEERGVGEVGKLGDVG